MSRTILNFKYPSDSIRNVLVFFLFLGAYLMPISGFAQIEVTSAASPPFNPTNLIKDQFLGEGIELVSVNFEGVNSSVGYFTNGSSSIGLNNGILLTTGVVNSQGADQGVNEPGSVQASADNGSSATDVDLDGLSPVNLFNVAKYTIEFIPTSDTLSFRYVFASEEYPEFVCSDYNDVFGFFISGPGISGSFDNGAINIASIPGTNLPVTINNVNGGIVGSQGKPENCNGSDGSLGFAQYYVDNDGSSSFPVFDGWLTPFEAKVAVQPCETYTIKIVIADQGDQQRDSGVFLEGKSFGSENVLIDVMAESLDGSIVEGCTDADLTFTLKSPRNVDTEIGLSFFGDATMGVDYSSLPSSVTIPAGEISVSITVAALEDMASENLEELSIATVVDQCRRDTINLYFKDASIPPINIEDVTICEGESTNFDVTIPVTSVPTTVSAMPFQPIISPPPNGTSPILISPIEVGGVDYQQLGPGMLESVCIDLDHGRLDDLSIYLRSPGGQLIVLSSKNGGTDDNYSGTCFTKDAADNISTGSAPFTGNWLPEEDFSNLWNGGSSVNGTWQLEIVDDKFGSSGILTNWSLTFTSIESFTYSWNSAPGLSCYDCPNPTASPTSTETYTVTVTDIYGCTTSDDVTVNITAGFAEAGDDQSICPGTSADLVASGGTSYVWSDGGLSPDITVSPMSTTMYYVTVTNDENCSSVDSVTVIISNSLSATLDKDDVSCNGLSNGSITANSSGTAPLTYAWDNGGDTQTINGLGTGSYTVTITDASSCSTVESINIDEPPLLTLTSSGTTSCQGQTDGSATVTIQGGGVSPFGNQWDAAAGNQTTATATNLAGGSYTVTVTDANMCTATQTVTVTEIDTLATPSVTCGNISSSSITFVWSADPKATGYMVNVDGAGWINADFNQSHEVSGLGLGQDVTIQVQGIGTCNPPIGTSTCKTINCTEITFSTPIITEVLCSGGNTGAVELQASGNNPPFVYTLNGSSNNNTGRFSDLTAGNYIVSVKDDLGCTNSIEFIIAEPTALAAVGSVVSQPNCDPASGAASATITGGTAPYTYEWNTGATTVDVSSLSGGNYTLTVTDANMCTTTTSVVLDPYINLTLSIALANAGCSESDNGAEATAQISGGTAPYTFLWNDESNQTTQTSVELEPGDYIVTVTDSDMCTIEESVSVSRPDIDMTFSVDPPLCADQPGSITLEPIMGQAPFRVSFDGNEYTGQLTFDNVASGTYNMSITDANGCSMTLTDIVVPTVEPIEILSIGESFTIVLGDSMEFQPQVLNSMGAVEFEWAIKDMSWITCPTCPYTFVQPTYSSQLDLQVTDANGCIATERVQLIVDRRRKVYIPTAISPNNDGRNDFFTVYTNGDGMIEELLIFDRWGSLVFERTEMEPNESNQGWDGIFNQKPVNNNRVFVYVAKLRFNDGETKIYDGSFVVLR